MKKAAITVNFDEEKTAALKLYLEQKGTSVEIGGTGVAEGFRKNVAEELVFQAENKLTEDMKES